ncbi:hypothetical protein INT43_008079 [Umbelopsis isabellina]|uniref:RGS domain-containing protein n=1 Tax=Mortierella isabellina TaxID=91625 RepID=A0A8H7U9Q3_MORIS|nr:hypothetical protein INT43_008079 [Umbelopsis isabellina]
MEVEHRPKQVKQRPSRLSLSSQNMADLSILSPRTPKSIGKPSSRRQSVAEQFSTISRRSSTASSVIAEFANPPGQPFTPNLLSEAISYFPDDSTSSPPTGRTRSCSLTSLANITGLANSDGHTLYKVKTTKTNRKLNNFFGEQPPLDICVREIRKEGLKALLQSKVPLCYFLYHLLEEFSSENLFFFIEVEQYESFVYQTQTQQLATAQHIYDAYLTRNSHFEVNLDDRVKRSVVTDLEARALDDIFHQAKQAVFGLLDHSFHRFLSSTTWHAMTENCGDLNTYYDEVCRNKAVNFLLQYLERQHDILYTNPHTDQLSASNSSRRRYEVLKSMIHEFCRTLLNVEFNYYKPEPADRDFVLKNNSTPSPPRTSEDRAGSKSPTKKNKERFDIFGRKK